MADAQQQELFLLLADARTTNSLAIAAVTIVLIEHVATFKDEVNLMWKSGSRRSLANMFYFWIRYFTLFALCIDISFMLRPQSSDHGELVTSTIITISADLILVLRVWILYQRRKSLLYFLIPLITAETTASLTVGYYTIKPLEQYAHLGPLLDGCYSLKVPRLFTFYTVAPLITAFTMFSMTLYKCGTTLMALGPGRTPIISMFLRDGVFWFLAILMLSVAEIVIWDRARPTLAQIPVVPRAALHAVIGARVILNIKHATSANFNSGNELTIPVFTTEMELEDIPRRRKTPELLPWYLRTASTSTRLPNETEN